ncbi:hypothetical protein WDW37_20585 [Bdellovibrionota bacterium FG-1]
MPINCPAMSPRFLVQIVTVSVFFTLSAFGGQTPTLEDPVQLFLPADAIGDEGLDLSTCISGPGHPGLPDHDVWQKMSADPKCRPDTLYSWGTSGKLGNLQQAMGEATPWASEMGDLFLARAPISTFAYGPIPIRVKLKAGVQFFGGVGLGCYGTDDIKNTVFYRNDGMYSDWAICSPSVIHSWSFAQPEHYDEMVLDYQGLKKHLPLSVDFYAFQQYEAGTYFYGGNFDGYTVFTEEMFMRKLVGILKDTLDQVGHIYYNPGIPPSEMTRAKHFETDHPVYFNKR